MKLKDYLETKREVIPTDFLDHMRKFQGKKLRSDMIPDGYVLQKNGYATHIVNVKDGKNFFISYNSTNIVVDVDQIEKLNHSYFEGARERNALLASIDVEKVEGLLEKIRSLNKELADAEKELDNNVHYWIRGVVRQFIQED